MMVWTRGVLVSFHIANFVNKNMGQQQNKLYPTVRKQRIVESPSSAGNLEIPLADIMGGR